ncbi:hypothetical protein ACWCW7_34435 [Nocardia tengchongensis]
MPDRDLAAERQYRRDRFEEMNERELVELAEELSDHITELKTELEQARDAATVAQGKLEAVRPQQDRLKLAWERRGLENDELQHRIAELGKVIEDQLSEIGDKGETITRLQNLLRAKDDQIADLEQQAKVAGQFDRWMSVLGWRCQATTTRATFLTPDDHRAIWCTLPNGHAGMHAGEIETEVPTGIADFMKTVPSQVHWSDGQPEVNRG